MNTRQPQKIAKLMERMRECLAILNLVQKGKLYDTQAEKVNAILERSRGKISALSTGEYLSPEQKGALAYVRNFLESPGPLLNSRGRRVRWMEMERTLMEINEDEEMLQQLTDETRVLGHDLNNALSVVVNEEELWEEVEKCIKILDEGRERKFSNKLSAIKDKKDINELRGLLNNQIKVTTLTSELEEIVKKVGGETRKNFSGRKIDFVAIIEDNDELRETVKLSVGQLVAEMSLAVEILESSDVSSAGALLKGREAQKGLVICDLGLPKNPEEKGAGKWSEINGMELLRRCGARHRILIITSIGNLFRVAAETLDIGPDDFVFKDSRHWKSELEQRISSILKSRISPQLLTIEIPYFSSGGILVGGIYIEVSPVEFEVVSALASPLPFTPDFLCPQDATDKKPADFYNVNEIVSIITSRAPGDTKGKYTQRTIKDGIRNLKKKVGEKFKKLSLDIDEERFIESRRETDDSVTEYRLGWQAILYENEQSFYEKRARLVNKCNVLVVEDEDFWWDKINNILAYRMPNLAVSRARNYEEALTEAENLKPSIVILDLNLPKDKTCSPEVGRELREQLLNMRELLGVVVFTGCDDDYVCKELTRLVGSGCNLPREDIFKRVRISDVIYKGKEYALEKLFYAVFRLRGEIERGMLMPLLLNNELRRITIDESREKVWLNDQEVKLRGRARGNIDTLSEQFELLLFLAKRNNFPLRRDFIKQYLISEGIFPKGIGDVDQRLTERIESLRKHLGKEVIQTFGEGYMLSGLVTLVTQRKGG